MADEKGEGIKENFPQVLLQYKAVLSSIHSNPKSKDL